MGLSAGVAAVRVVAHLVVGGAGVHREAVHHPLEVLPPGAGARVVVMLLQAEAVEAWTAVLVVEKAEALVGGGIVVVPGADYR